MTKMKKAGDLADAKEALTTQDDYNKKKEYLMRAKELQNQDRFLATLKGKK